MITTKTYQEEVPVTIAKKIADYAALIKVRLSMLVVFSAAISFSLASEGAFDWSQLGLLVIGGFLTTGSANSLNQIFERELDKKMSRTAGRPLPSGSMSLSEAWVSSVLMGLLGVLILGFGMNWLSGMLGLISIISYAFIYTPLKIRTPFAVFIGAFPGAIPAMLGWVAASNSLSIEAWTLFAIQFVWQFPHFWAIAWVLHDDYQKAGFHLLPSSGGRDKRSAFQTVLYTMVLIPVSLLPVKFGMADMLYASVAIICGLVFFWQAVTLYRTCSLKAAQQLMFGSFLYLPVVQLMILIDKI